MTPPVARPDVVRAEPAAIVVTVRVQQVWTVTHGATGFVHGNDADQAHGFDVRIRELFTDEAGHFGVRFRELAPFGLSANFRLYEVVVLEEHTLQDGDLGRDVTRRYKAWRTEQMPCVASDAETVAPETLDPFLAGGAIGGDAEVDHTIFLKPLWLLLALGRLRFYH